MPDWPALLYSGQTLSRSADIKSTLLFVTFQPLDPTEGHPPDISPRSCRGPPVLTEGPWQVQHIFFSLYLTSIDIFRQLDYMPGHPHIYRLLFLLQKLSRPVPGYSGRNLFPGQLFRHDVTSFRSQARQFASKLATALPPRTVTRCDGSQRIYYRPSWPSGSVTGTAAPLRAATWRPPAETVGVVEHSP
jgi:hypothetical protein